MPKFETVLYEKRGGVAVITLNRPEKLNALNSQMNRDLKYALKEARDDPEVRVIVLTGAGRGFCSGADISDFAGGVTLEDFRRMTEQGVVPETIITPYDLIDVPKPIIAAVNGVAVGFGMNVLLNCDIIIASEAASFGEFFIRMGLIPDMNGSLLLPMLVGIHKAKELIFTGDRISAHEALRIGLVNRVVPPDELMPTAMELANRLAEGPPLALAMSKKLIHEGFRKIFDEMIVKEVQYQAKLYASEDHREAALAFLEKRKPVFRGK
ncbi:MAG: enoyl-CoA hydratase [Candidatus Freyarchaeota archaeon]|nr:enoyl-CoA hydratase [Candidatus Jordarchaeia archaeon]MBS7267316.1 enoyl-CoA hydratase [Candidatus Jordarchaeia archaeon]MBS7278252.1 enoyl-CoA hydratase [Candidatus Jordarchaeia archaeon]